MGLEPRTQRVLSPVFTLSPLLCSRSPVLGSSSMGGRPFTGLATQDDSVPLHSLVVSEELAMTEGEEAVVVNAKARAARRPKPAHCRRATRSTAVQASAPPPPPPASPIDQLTKLVGSHEEGRV